MPLHTYELISEDSSKLGVAVAATEQRALELAKHHEPDQKWASVKQVRWRELYHSFFFPVPRPSGECFGCQRNPREGEAQRE